eukprot:jgi/Orpsp1_1/1178005/evm.model.c7180000063702.1
MIIIIRNIELHTVYGQSMGNILFYSDENSDNSYFHVTNGTFIDFYQDLSTPISVKVASSVIIAYENIDIVLK